MSPPVFADAKNDYVLLRIFGGEANKPVLIGFCSWSAHRRRLALDLLSERSTTLGTKQGLGAHRPHRKLLRGEESHRYHVEAAVREKRRLSRDATERCS
jgi:hypothetical protein